MSARQKRLILVTGAPRSGTTAIGQMLALGRTVGTLHEPFNQIVGMREVTRYFEVPGSGEFPELRLDECVANLRQPRLSLKKNPFPREQGLRRTLKQIGGGRAMMSYLACRANPFLTEIIWKDPFACFAARRLRTVHEIPVVAVARDPFAVAGSFKRMRWSFDLDDIATRHSALGTGLVARSLPGWDERSTPAINGALLWHIIHDTLLKWCQRSVPILLVNLDDVLTAPVVAYSRLYLALGLSWTPPIESRIARHYGRKTAKASPREGRPHDKDRDLASINLYWRGLLDSKEIEVIDSLNGRLWTLTRERCLCKAPSQNGTTLS